MPIEAQTPQLDKRTFEDLRIQLIQRIPRYTPDWTDWNRGDPGMTLIELFAWLSELMLGEMNRIPDRNYLKFLQILGLELDPAQPAIAHLTFAPEETAKDIPSVPQYAQIAGQSATTGTQLIFETEDGLSLIRLPLNDVQVFDGSVFTVVTDANKNPGTTFRPFGWQPLPGSALYFGFKQSDPPLQGKLFPDEMRWRVFLPTNEISLPPFQCQPNTLPSKSPVTLVWEYRSTSDPGYWRRLQVFKDDSLAFTREGAIQVQGPTNPALTTEGRVQEKRIWIRVRLADGAYPAGGTPLIDFIRPNVVDAKNLATVRDEPVGTSGGVSPQVFNLRFSPVVNDSLKLSIEEPNSDPDLWIAKPDLLSSGPDDPHFQFIPATGQISFGDGINGRIPVAGAVISASEYRYGGGEAGNLVKQQITSILTPVTGVASVTNERPAAGGHDEETVSHLVKFAPAKLRCNERAVSAEDFTSLARNAGGIGNAIALPLFHPDHPGVNVPGAVTLVVVPDTADRPPRPSPDQRESVCEAINPHRLITTELYVVGPDYVLVQVEAVVQANPRSAFDVVRQEVIEALNDYLDPLIPDKSAGKSSDGVTPRRMPGPRTFGEDLYLTQLYAIIHQVKDVRAINISAVTVKGERIEDLTQSKKLEANQMTYGALDHLITVVPYEDQ